MPALSFEPARTALLMMDFQLPIVERVPAGAREGLLTAAAEVIAAARRAAVPVLYVVVGFRSGFPEISPRNQSFSALKAAGGISSEIHPRVAPAAGEAIVIKRRVSAFWGTDLDLLLRAQERDTLVLCGIATSGVVLSTLRHAADADYRLAVLRDCCADPDATVHACLLDKVFPRQASIAAAADFIAALSH